MGLVFSNETHSECLINTIPYELLDYILKFVPKCTIACCLYVCKLWHKLAIKYVMRLVPQPNDVLNLSHIHTNVTKWALTRKFPLRPDTVGLLLSYDPTHAYCRKLIALCNETSRTDNDYVLDYYHHIYLYSGIIIHNDFKTFLTAYDVILHTIPTSPRILYTVLLTKDREFLTWCKSHYVWIYNTVDSYNINIFEYECNARDSQSIMRLLYSLYYVAENTNGKPSNARINELISYIIDTYV